MHGLPDQSKTQHLVERIPWYIKPAVPAFFNLINSAMRWASLLFVSASVAEMLISGMELVLSVLATKCVRGREVTQVRWVGVGVCTIGIILVGIFDSMNGANISSIHAIKYSNQNNPNGTNTHTHPTYLSYLTPSYTLRG